MLSQEVDGSMRQTSLRTQVAISQANVLAQQAGDEAARRIEAPLLKDDLAAEVKACPVFRYLAVEET